MDVRKAIAEQIGGLTIQVFELTARVQSLVAENEQLKAQSKPGADAQQNECLPLDPSQ